jgi:hypothetical protein
VAPSDGALKPFSLDKPPYICLGSSVDVGLRFGFGDKENEAGSAKTVKALYRHKQKKPLGQIL